MEGRVGSAATASPAVFGATRGNAACCRPAAPASCRASTRQGAAGATAARHAPAASGCARLAARRLWARQRDAARRTGSALAATLEPEDGPGWWERGAELPNARVVSSTPELLDALSTAGDKLVVVHFYAAWCAACKALHPKLVQIMESREDVQFVKVNYDDNKNMARTLGVKVLPTFHMYRGPSGRVAEFSASLSKIQRLRDALEAHGAPRCVLGDATPVLPTELTDRLA